jgi:hypothetical protein
LSQRYPRVTPQNVSEKDEMSRKKEQQARKKLLAMPWWKVKDNWYFMGLLIFLFGVVVFAALA